jgi:hypothetical protein
MGVVKENFCLSVEMRKKLLSMHFGTVSSKGCMGRKSSKIPKSKWRGSDFRQVFEGLHD